MACELFKSVEKTEWMADNYVKSRQWGPSCSNEGLKVHKNENFFGFDFEFCSISLLVMSKY